LVSERRSKLASCGGEDLCNLGGDKLGKVEAISFDDCTVDFKKRQDSVGIHPEAMFAHKYVEVFPFIHTVGPKRLRAVWPYPVKIFILTHHRC
jgi:hypothetical protein